MKNRSSYLTKTTEKNTLVWPLSTIVSFLIILILLVLLIFGYLDSLNNVIKATEIAQNLEETKKKYEEMKEETEQATKKLADIKQEIALIDNSNGNSGKFMTEIRKSANLRASFAEKTYSSLNTRNILKKSNSGIFINANGDLTMLTSYLFNDNESTFKPESKDMFKFLSKQLAQILSSSELKPYIKQISIEVHLPEGYNDNDVILANKRAENFRLGLINANASLKKTYKKKIAIVNMLDNKLIFKGDDAPSNSRIEIVAMLDSDAIKNTISTFDANLQALADKKKAEEAKTLAQGQSTMIKQEVK